MQFVVNVLSFNGTISVHLFDADDHFYATFNPCNFFPHGNEVSELLIKAET